MPGRLSLVAAVAAVAVVALAGCRLDVHVTTTVAVDGSGTVTVEATADDGLLDQVPDLLADLRLDDLAAAGWTVEGPTATSEDGASVRLTKPFRTPAEATAALQELNGPQGPLRDLQVGRTERFAEVETTFEGAVHLEGGLEAFADTALAELLGDVPLGDVVTVPLDQGLQLVVTAVLPGDLVATTGTQLDAGTARWDPPLADGAVTVLEATAVERDEGARSARRNQRLATAALVLWAAAMLGLGVVWWARRRAGSPTA